MARGLARLLWMQRSFKKMIPLVSGMGVVTDVANPLVNLSEYPPLTGLTDLLTALLAIATLGMTIYWFSIGRKKLQDVDQPLFVKVFAYCIIATLVFGFFSFSQAITDSQDRGVVAKYIPGIKSMQESLFRLEKTTQEMNKKLDKIESDVALLDKKYTLEDLEILADQEYWDEVIEHLEDIPALNRGERWQAVVEKAAIGWLEPMLYSENIEEAHLKVKDFFNRFKTLKKSDEAMELKEELGMKYLEICLRAKPLRDCYNASMSLIIYHRGRVVDIARRVANLTTYERLPRGAMPFYAHGLKRAGGDVVAINKICDDDRVSLAVYSGFLDFERSPFYKQAIEVLKICKDKASEDLIKELKKASGGTYIITRACPLFLEMGIEEELCKEKMRLAEEYQKEKERKQQLQEKKREEQRNKRAKKNKKRKSSERWNASAPTV